ncbi:MAG: 50S ribosomal protein L25 [Candidatus Latescibacterota bacterium]
MAEATLKAMIRTERGKQAAKHLRQQGSIPGVLYGPGEQPSPLRINLKEFVTLLHANGRNVVVNLIVEDSPAPVKAFIYEIQHDPISGDIIHVDLKHISLKEKIHVTVPVHLTGIPVGVKTEGGILEHIMHTVEISCFPHQIPDAITLNVTELHTGAIIHVKDIPHEEFDLLSEPEATVIHIVTPRVVAGEEQPSEVGPVEPEVIGKKEEE